MFLDRNNFFIISAEIKNSESYLDIFEKDNIRGKDRDLILRTFVDLISLLAIFKSIKQT